MSQTIGETFDVFVPDGDVPLAVRVYRHPDADAASQPTVVCAGSWLTVKEQMAERMPRGWPLSASNT